MRNLLWPVVAVVCAFAAGAALAVLTADVDLSESLVRFVAALGVSR